MPTGYKAAIADGIIFPDFVKSCARSMGACIMQREDASGPEIKFDEPSTHYAEMIARYEAELINLRSLDQQQAAIEYESALAKAVADDERSQRKNKELRDKYEAMLAEVAAWTPPTPEHENLKTFMREQIQESIKFDCGSSYHWDIVQKRMQQTPQGWLRERIGEAQRMAENYRRFEREEIERCRERNEWKRKLIESLETQGVKS